MSINDIVTWTIPHATGEYRKIAMVVQIDEDGTIWLTDGTSTSKLVYIPGATQGTLEAMSAPEAETHREHIRKLLKVHPISGGAKP